MFGFSSSKKAEQNTPKQKEARSLSIIAAGVTIVGDIESAGDIRIEGKLIGNLVCNARVVIDKGCIEGSIDTVNASIAGEINGELYVRELLKVMQNGKINGEICTGRMAVEDGAVIIGNIKMGNDSKEFFKSKPLPTISHSNNNQQDDSSSTNHRQQTANDKDRKAKFTKKDFSKTAAN